MELNVKATAANLILVRELAEGPKKFAQLRRAYYGEGRAENKSTTSFYNKLVAAQEKKVIVKTALGYEIGEQGLLLLAYVKEQKIDLSRVKSEAQARYEAQA